MNGQVAYRTAHRTDDKVSWAKIKQSLLESLRAKRCENCQIFNPSLVVRRPETNRRLCTTTAKLDAAEREKLIAAKLCAQLDSARTNGALFVQPESNQRLINKLTNEAPVLACDRRRLRHSRPTRYVHCDSHKRAAQLARSTLNCTNVCLMHRNLDRANASNGPDVVSDGQQSVAQRYDEPLARTSAGGPAPARHCFYVLALALIVFPLRRHFIPLPEPLFSHWRMGHMVRHDGESLPSQST